MTFERSKEIADIALKYVSIAAIVLGGTWAVYQFWITDTTAPNIELSVSVEILDYSPKTQMMVVHVKPKNIGKVLVKLENRNFPVVAREVTNDLNMGPIDVKKLSISYFTDLRTRFPEGYELEHGVTYNELWAIIVPACSAFAVTATMNLQDGSEVDDTAIANIPCAKRQTRNERPRPAVRPKA
jgi:hypothetical protein